MPGKYDLLSQIKPLADPLRIATILLVVLAVVGTMVGVATGSALSARRNTPRPQRRNQLY